MYKIQVATNVFEGTQVALAAEAAGRRKPAMRMYVDGRWTDAESGIGREGGLSGMQEYTETQCIAWTS